MRYSRNCSIFKKSKEGRIQEEIQNFVCSEFKVKKDKKINGFYYIKGGINKHYKVVSRLMRETTHY